MVKRFLWHGVQRVKQLDGDNDQRLLGRFALGLLAEINGAPLATTAHGIDGGEVERMARKARADGRQAGSRRVGAALLDGENRWGDYSVIAVDPMDGSFWTLAEYML
jgi:hypothetical protein